MTKKPCLRGRDIKEESISVKVGVHPPHVHRPHACFESTRPGPIVGLQSNPGAPQLLQTNFQRRASLAQANSQNRPPHPKTGNIYARHRPQKLKSMLAVNIVGSGIQIVSATLINHVHFYLWQ
jgi:hypothetical protein